MFVRAVLFGLLGLFAMTSAAEALCISTPETAQSGYTANNTAYALCLQEELADAQHRAAQQAQLRAALDDIANLQLQQKLSTISTYEPPSLPPQ